MESLGRMRNLYLPDGTWAGQFMDEATAKAWATKQGYKLSECEISTRKVDRGDYRGLSQYSVSTEDYEVISDDKEDDPQKGNVSSPTIRTAFDVSEKEVKTDQHLMQFFSVLDIQTIKKVLY